MRLVALIAVGTALWLATPSAASAAEVFGGVHVHDVKTPLDLSGIEKGFDVSIGYRGDRIGRTPLQPYGFVALHTAGDTHYAAVGLSAKFGRQVYVRPGLGLAVHSGSAKDYRFSDRRIAFGSRILLEPELAIGAQLSDRISIEASLVHMSHATLFSRQNPGIDNIGVRVNVGL